MPARDRRHPDRAGAHRHGEVVGQGHQPVHFTPGRRRDVVLGHDGPGGAPATSPSTLKVREGVGERSAAGRARASPASTTGARRLSRSTAAARRAPRPPASWAASGFASWHLPSASSSRRPSGRRPRALGSGSSAARLARSVSAAAAALRQPRRPLALPPRGRSGCRSSRCSGCHAKVARVSARGPGTQQHRARDAHLGRMPPRRSRAARPTTRAEQPAGTSRSRSLVRTCVSTPTR